MAKKKIDLPVAEEKPKTEAQERRQNLKNSLDLLRDIQRLLQTGHFPGQKAPVVIAGMQYLEAIAKQIREELNATKD